MRKSSHPSIIKKSQYVGGYCSIVELSMSRISKLGRQLFPGLFRANPPAKAVCKLLNSGRGLAHAQNGEDILMMRLNRVDHPRVRRMGGNGFRLVAVQKSYMFFLDIA